jgi:hypothetical protein
MVQVYFQVSYQSTRQEAGRARNKREKSGDFFYFIQEELPPPETHAYLSWDRTVSHGHASCKRVLEIKTFFFSPKDSTTSVEEAGKRERIRREVRWDHPWSHHTS